MSDSTHELYNMPDVLVPYTEFAANDLAKQLHEVVTRNTELLTVRGLIGVISRYSDLETAQQKVRKGQTEMADIGHFAVVNFTGDVVGSASILPRMPLKKQRIPLPPILAQGPLTVIYPYAHPNIHAWTDSREMALLGFAYYGLVDRTSGLGKRLAASKPWTLEPTKSPQAIHIAISSGGLDEIMTRRFDDFESRRHIPPRSTLYAKLYSEWSGWRGRRKELKTGAKSRATMLQEEKDERTSRNPSRYR